MATTIKIFILVNLIQLFQFAFMNFSSGGIFLGNNHISEREFQSGFTKLTSKRTLFSSNPIANCGVKAFSSMETVGLWTLRSCHALHFSWVAKVYLDCP